MKNPGASRWVRVAAAVVAGLGVLCAVVLPLAPILVDDPVITWPRVGRPATSTVALFYPYRPLQLDVTIPCAALPQDRSTPATVFATFPEDSAIGHKYGLYITLDDNTLRFEANGRHIHTEHTIPTTCAYSVRAHDNTITITDNGTELTRAEGLVPQTAAFITDLTAPAAAAGISAVAHADARYQSSPTPLKYALIAITGVLAIALALLPWLLYPPARTRRPETPDNKPPLNRRVATTLFVITALGAWAIIGPTLEDDGYYTAMAVNETHSGYIGNYYAWLNASETPFTTAGWFYSLWATISSAPLIMRIPSLVCGIASWYAFRGIVTLIDRARSAALALPLQACCFLCWWLPYNSTIRPEPLVALAIAISAYATARTLTGSTPAWLTLGTLSAAIATTISATGLIALIPPLLALPTTLRRTPNPVRLVAILGTGTITTASLIVFSSTSAGQLIAASDTHRWYFDALHWYDEIDRYKALMEEPSLRRVPIIITIAVIATIGLLGIRKPRPQSAPFDTQVVWWLVGGLMLLTVTPSKWEHHFGALAVLGALALAYCITKLQHALPTSSRTFQCATLALALSCLTLTWSGTNTWWRYSTWGMLDTASLPFGAIIGHPITIFTALIGFILVVDRLRGRHPTTRQRLGAFASVGTLALYELSAYFAVVSMLVSFTSSALAKAPWTYARSGANTVSARPDCGIADKIMLKANATEPPGSRPQGRPASDTGTLVAHAPQSATEPISSLGNLTDLLSSDRAPTIVDQQIRFAFPCAKPPAVSDGLLEPPVLVVSDIWGHHWAGEQSTGGALPTIYEVGQISEIETQLDGFPSVNWGSVGRMSYRYSIGEYSTQVSATVLSGTWRGAPVDLSDYSGRTN